MSERAGGPRVGLIMGSDSDWSVMEDAATALAEFEVPFEVGVVSAHRTPQRMLDYAKTAADRGVEVHVIWDEFANLVVPPKFYQQLPDRIRTLRLPAMPIPWSPRTWGRDHRKLLVVDGVIGFIGGYNIGSLYATRWRDTHARVTGSAALDLANAFVDYWNQARRPHMPELTSPGGRSWDAPVKVTRNVPSIGVYPIRYSYLEAIDRASERIWMTHAYLIPDDVLTLAPQVVDLARVVRPAELVADRRVHGGERRGPWGRAREQRQTDEGRHDPRWRG